MSSILLINPKKRAPKKRKAKKGVSKVPKKKRKAPVKRRKTSRKRRKNPSRVRAAASRARGAFAGLNFKGALKNVPATQIGMFAAKWAAKRFSDEYSATEDDPESWNYASYLKGGAGCTVAAVIANMLRPGWGQKVLEGGINLMTFKLIENELIPQSDWATEQFGQGEIYTDEAGTPYMLGQGGYYPVDERHRLPEEMLGDVLEPVGALGQATLEPVGRLGEDDPWSNAYLGQDGSPSTDPFVQAYM